MKAKIYLDFNSTHPPDTGALATAREFYFENYANSSGLSLASQLVNKRIEQAREDIASLFALRSEQVIFTSCATESNNLLIREFSSRRKSETFRVVSSPFEHPSVVECLKQLPQTEITYLPVDAHGGIAAAEFGKIAWSDFDLIVMMAVQNESGVILPLRELAAALPEKHPPVLADFSQALPKLARDAVPELNPDILARLTAKNFFLTATGHKVGAGFGAGLIVTPVLGKIWKDTALLAGGNQEHGYRAGSHNTEAIIALSEALKKRMATVTHGEWKETGGRLEKLLLEKIPPQSGVQIIGAGALRAPGTTLLLLPGIPIDFLVMALDKHGITVSTGTSCKSRSRSPSAALLAMGFTEAQALSVVRLSYSQKLPPADMVFVAETLAATIRSLA